jgi:GNAT superfamily N-acetyltransferase
MRVWVADAEDAGRVAALMAGFRDHMDRDTPADDEIRASVDTLLSDPATEYLLAAPDGQGEPAGICQLRYRLAIWTGTHDCWLEDLFVERAARRTGLGRALVTAALERARARGCRRIELDVNEQNEGALRFYESLGFTTEPKPPGRTLFVSRRL